MMHSGKATILLPIKWQQFTALWNTRQLLSQTSTDTHAFLELNCEPERINTYYLHNMHNVLKHLPPNGNVKLTNASVQQSADFL